MSFTQLELLQLKPADLERLRELHGAGLTAAQLAQTFVKLKDLHIAPQVFQPRLDVEEPWIKGAHIRALMQAAKQNEENRLAPILVFPVGGYRIIVDGHCRAEAYRRIDRSQNQKVPVRHLTETFREALFLAAAGNSHDKLPLTQREKAEFAWKIVRFEEGRSDLSSTRKIEAKTGCSKSLVNQMRQLLVLHPKSTEGTASHDPRDETWLRAKFEDRPKLDEFDREAWKEKWITDVATKLRASFGKKPERQRDLFLEAINRAYPGFVRGIEEDYGIDGEGRPSEF